MQCRLILWRGARHSGKTTAAGKLAEQARDEGFRVAGLLAPSIYVNGRLVLKRLNLLNLSSLMSSAPWSLPVTDGAGA